jgi:GT2 family glycosyltransferase
MVRQLGGLRGDPGPALEYHLALRIAARSQKIEHVADVLYHTNTTRTREPAALRAGAPVARALEDYLRATGRHASVEPGPAPGLKRVRFAIGRPRVSIIIPTAYRRRPTGSEAFLARCLSSIRARSTYSNFQIVLLDNGNMPDDLAGALSRDQVTRVPYALPFNWAAAINKGANLADGEHLLILDDDTEVITSDWIECLLEYSQQADIGVVGARLDFPDGRLQHAGVTVLDGVPGHPFYRRAADDAGYFHSSIVPRNWSAVTGACLMTRADVFRSVGGFDESFGLNFNDIDYCLRVASSGRRVVCTPFARLLHYETATKTEFRPGELEAFKRRWQSGWPADPFYNPNLSKRFHDFRVEA